MYFPESSGVRIIAEPGRYFVASAFTLATNVIAKRTVPRDMVNVGDDSKYCSYMQLETRIILHLTTILFLT